jgi:transcriptional regulator with XRE-family HTH domain
MNLNSLVRSRMQAKKVTFQRLADETGYSKSYLSDLVCGRRRWNIDTMQKVFSALEIKWQLDVEGVKIRDDRDLQNRQNIDSGSSSEHHTGTKRKSVG